MCYQDALRGRKVKNILLIQRGEKEIEEEPKIGGTNGKKQ